VQKRKANKQQETSRRGDGKEEEREIKTGKKESDIYTLRASKHPKT
jgi:hypothetical protein